MSWKLQLSTWIKSNYIILLTHRIVIFGFAFLLLPMRLELWEEIPENDKVFQACDRHIADIFIEILQEVRGDGIPIIFSQAKIQLHARLE